MILLAIILCALATGSFISLISYRLVRNEPIVFTRSRCPKCKSALKILDLIPLISWIKNRGRCRNCKSKISIRYPLIELTTLVLFLLIYFRFFTLEKTILLSLIAAVLLTLTITDIEKYIIPDSLQFSLAILAGLFYLLEYKGGNFQRLIDGGFISALAYLATGLLLLGSFYFFTKQEAIGIDDLKLLFTLGFLLGLKNALAFMLITGIAGIVFGLIWKKFYRQSFFPFAPALCLAAFVCLVYRVDLVGLI